MNVRTRNLCITSFAVLALGAGLWLLNRPTPTLAPVVTQKPASVSQPVVASATTAVADLRPAAVPENAAELAATASMYAAHAPLRVLEVADPDSKTNKQILQTMVAKALEQKRGTTSAANP